MAALSLNVAGLVGGWFGSAAGSVARQSALVIPPAGPGSVGDAAMLTAVASELRQFGTKQVDIIAGARWERDDRFDRWIGGEGYFSDGSPLKWGYLVAQAARYQQVYMVGADVIDGAYAANSVRRRVELLGEFARRGANGILLGSSFNATPSPVTVGALRALPEKVVICARDPLSRSRMEQFLDRPIRQTADLAFLVDPDPTAPEAVAALEWVREMKAEGHPVVGFNANFLQAAGLDGFGTAIRDLMRCLLDAGVRIMLVPHDSRTSEPDAALLTKAVAGLPAGLQSHTMLLGSLKPTVIKAVLAELDFLVTGRMHAAILALGARTVPFSLVYQDKFEGLYGLFDLHDRGLLATPREMVQSPEAVGRRVLDGLSRKEELQRILASRHASVIDLARSNFDGAM